MTNIDISNMDKPAVLVKLYNNSRSQGMGFLPYTPKDMTLSEAKDHLTKQSYFDYLNGRVMKVDLSEDSFDPWLYDRDNGEDAALRAITS